MAEQDADPRLFHGALKGLVQIRHDRGAHRVALGNAVDADDRDVADQFVGCQLLAHRLNSPATQ